jgi:hypothetical protein
MHLLLMWKKLYIIAETTESKRSLTIALIAGKIFAPNVLFMVTIFSKLGNHKDHNVKMIKKAIAEVKEDYM